MGRMLLAWLKNQSGIVVFTQLATGFYKDYVFMANKNLSIDLMQGEISNLCTPKSNHQSGFY
jgi:hypothetical protein